MTKDTLPTKAPESNGLAVPTEDPWAEMCNSFDDGLDNFIEEFGLSLPRIKTDFGRNGKGFVYPDGAATKFLKVVLLACPPSRQFWFKSLDEEPNPGPPDCRSYDMERPDPASPALQSDTCATCPHSQWRTSDDGDRIKPRCAQAANLFVYDFDQESFYWLRVASKGLAPLRSHISALKARSLPMFAAVTNVELAEQSKGKLEWLEPRFSIGDPLQPADVIPMREIAKSAMKSVAQVADEMAAEGKKEAGPFDGPANERPFTDDDITVDAEPL